MSIKDKVFNENYTILLRGRVYSLDAVKVMGILNLTSDSFYAGSRQTNVFAALSRIEQMQEEGVHWIDLGAASSRPGALLSDPQSEIEALLPVLSAARERFPDLYFSIDTYHKKVAQAMADAGADIINDISGGGLDEEMLPFIAQAKLPYIGMHMRGNPQAMNELSSYNDVAAEVTKELSGLVHRSRVLGINDLLLDPGFGFAKQVAQNYELLGGLEKLKTLNCPLLVGLSRKSMIYKVLNSSPEDALNGTAVLNSIACLKGASVLRVHDVKEAVELVRLISYYSENKKMT